MQYMLYMKFEKYIISTTTPAVASITTARQRVRDWTALVTGNPCSCGTVVCWYCTVASVHRYSTVPLCWLVFFLTTVQSLQCPLVQHLWYCVVPAESSVTVTSCHFSCVRGCVCVRVRVAAFALPRSGSTLSLSEWQSVCSAMWMWSWSCHSDMWYRHHR